MLVLLTLLVVAGGVAVYVSPDPLTLGPVTVAGPRCDDIGFFVWSYAPPAGPGQAGTTTVTSHSTVMRRWPPSIQLTVTGTGAGNVIATAGAGGPPIRAVAGRPVWQLAGVTIVVR